MVDGREFVSEIVGKMVYRDDRVLGRIEDIAIDTSTGLIKYLILSASLDISDMVDDRGRAVVPVKRMHLDQEYVTIL